MTPEQKRLWDAVVERDGGTCIQCGMAGSEVAHIVSRGRKGAWQTPNMACLCRSCHLGSHNVRARGILLSELRARYGYEYKEEPWAGILRLHDFVTSGPV